MKRKHIQRLWRGKPFLLANLRNDVLHTGFRENQKSADEIIAQTKKIANEIDEITRLWEPN